MKNHKYHMHLVYQLQMYQEAVDWDFIYRLTRYSFWIYPKSGPGLFTSYVVVCICSVSWGEWR